MAKNFLSSVVRFSRKKSDNALVSKITAKIYMALTLVVRFSRKKSDNKSKSLKITGFLYNDEHLLSDF